jgi:hypothetical protein
LLSLFKEVEVDAEGVPEFWRAWISVRLKMTQHSTVETLPTVYDSLTPTRSLYWWARIVYSLAWISLFHLTDALQTLSRSLSPNKANISSRKYSGGSPILSCIVSYASR